MADKEIFDPDGYVNIKDAWDFDVGLEFVEVGPKSDYREKIKNKIEPFLDNLAKNPEKDIHWPNRDERIAKFKQELWDIIDGR